MAAESGQKPSWNKAAEDKDRCKRVLVLRSITDQMFATCAVMTEKCSLLVMRLLCFWFGRTARDYSVKVRFSHIM